MARPERFDRVEIEAGPFLAVTNMRDTVRWYEEKLGFEIWFEDDSVSGVSWGDFTVRLFLNPRLAEEVGRHRADPWGGHWIWLDAEPIGSIHAEHVERGAKIFEPLTPRDIGFHEYNIVDPNGYLLRFVSQIEFVEEKAELAFDEDLVFEVIQILAEWEGEESDWILSDWLELAQELKIDLSGARRMAWV